MRRFVNVMVTIIDSDMTMFVCLTILHSLLFAFHVSSQLAFCTFVWRNNFIRALASGDRGNAKCPLSKFFGC